MKLLQILIVGIALCLRLPDIAAQTYTAEEFGEYIYGLPLITYEGELGDLSFMVGQDFYDFGGNYPSVSVFAEFSRCRMDP